MTEKAGDIARSLAEVDRIIHEPARLMIVTILAVVESADFIYLQHETGLSKGNLSSHLTRLEEADYVKIKKTFRGKIPLTLCSLTESGQQAFQNYREKMKRIMEYR